MRGLQLKLLRYFFTAGAAAVVDVGGFALLCLTPIPIAVAAVTSFCLATVVNYLLTSRFVFHRVPTVRGFGLFFVAAVGGLLVNVSVTLAGTSYLGMAPVLAKLAGVGTAFLCNFWLNLRVVFRAPAP
ncbi:MAG TPA: GtrA family protein [Steroidobacteraceae bacterium]|jgi:putative flippase GtrA